MTVVASKYARAKNDLYQTEPWATEALLRHLPNMAGWHVWEPTAGNHLMADVIAEATGEHVLTSDIATYDREHDLILDFLDREQEHPQHDCKALIGNPPYGKSNRDAVKFASLALERFDGWIALLLTAKFDFGKTRHHLFRDNPRFVLKINLCDRIQWFPGEHSGTEDHAWYVWGPKHMPNAPRHPSIIYEVNRGKK